MTRSPPESPLEVLDEPACGEAEHSPGGLRPLDVRSVEPAVRVFRALADAERLRLLHLLSQGERCVSDLAAALNAPMPAISQRLRLLRADGLVARRRSGKHAFYALADPHVEVLLRNALEHGSEAHPPLHEHEHD
jgi:DNA-binding transcriptional ArsR family regulator